MPNPVHSIPLTTENIQVLTAGSEQERADLIAEYANPSLDKLQPMELARHAWRWVTEKASGREAVLWVPAIYNSEKLNTQVVMVLNPDQPGEMLEFVASDTRLIEGVLPVDFTKREVNPEERPEPAPEEAEFLGPVEITDDAPGRTITLEEATARA